MAKLGRWVAKLVARLCLLRQLSGFESRHLSKIQKGRHRHRRGQHNTLARRKIYIQKSILHVMQYPNTKNFFRTAYKCGLCTVPAFMEEIADKNKVVLAGKLLESTRK